MSSHNKRQDIAKIEESGTLSLSSTSSSFDGPLPPPDQLEHYDRIAPGFAGRFLAMVEEEGKHRRECEKKGLEAAIELNRTAQANDHDEARRGQYFGLIIGIVSIASGAYVVVSGSPVAGSIVGSSGVVGLVAAFIAGRKNEAPDEAPPKTPSKATTGGAKQSSRS